MDQHKLAVIPVDGKIERRGEQNDERLFHAICLLDYIKEKYPNNETLKKLNARHTADTIAYFLTLYGNIVIFNATKQEEKYGKSAYLMMPVVLTEEQRKSLEELLKSMSTYFLTIAYDTKIVEGILDGKELSPTEKKPPIEVLEMYYNKLGIAQKKGDIVK